MTQDELLEFNGEMVRAIDLAERHGISWRLAQNRRHRGLSRIEACTRPVEPVTGKRLGHAWHKAAVTPRRKTT